MELVDAVSLDQMEALSISIIVATFGGILMFVGVMLVDQADLPAYGVILLGTGSLLLIGAVIAGVVVAGD